MRQCTKVAVSNHASHRRERINFGWKSFLVNGEPVSDDGSAVGVFAFQFLRRFVHDLRQRNPGRRLGLQPDIQHILWVNATTINTWRDHKVMNTFIPFFQPYRTGMKKITHLSVNVNISVRDFPQRRHNGGRTTDDEGNHATPRLKVSACVRGGGRKHEIYTANSLFPAEQYSV